MTVVRGRRHATPKQSIISKAEGLGDPPEVSLSRVGREIVQTTDSSLISVRELKFSKINLHFTAVLWCTPYGWLTSALK